MINKLKIVILATMVGVFTTTPAYADDSSAKAGGIIVDEQCSAAFDSKGKVIPESYIVCQQDVALNAMTLSIGSVVNDNEAAKSIYGMFGIPVPTYSDIVTFISKPIGAVAAAAVNLSLILIIIFAGGRLALAGYKAMKDAELANMARDPSNYKSFLGFGLVASLAYQVGDVSVAQLLIIGSALAGIMITTYLFTAMISVFEFSSDAADDFTDYESFIPQGEMYATSLVSSLYGAQTAAITSNFTNVSPKNANLIASSSKGNMFDKLFASIFGEFGIYLQQDPSAKDYFDAIYGDSYLTLRQPSGITLRSSGAHSGGIGAAKTLTRSVASSNLSVKGGRVDAHDKTGFNSPIFEKAYSYSDIFNVATTLSASSPIPSVSPSVLTQISKSSAISAYEKLLIVDSGSDMTKEKEDGLIEDAGKSVLQLIDEVIESNPEVKPIDVVSSLQAMALGAISVEALSSKKFFINKTFHPFMDSSEFKARLAKEPFHFVFAEAMASAKELRAYNCLRNFDDAGREFQFFKKLKDEGNDWDANFSSYFKGGDIYPICLYPSVGNTSEFENLAPKKMVEGALEAVGKIEEGVSDSGDVGAVLAHMANVAANERFTKGGTASNEISAALERAQAHQLYIAKYFARVASVGKYAALKYVDNGEEEAKGKFMKNLRLQGAMAISSYFMQLSQEQQKYSDVIYNSEPKVTMTSNLYEASGMPPQTGKLQTEIALSEKRALFPSNQWITTAHLNTDNIDQAAISKRGDDPSSDGDQVVSNFVAQAADYVIPSQDILMAGFGLEGDTWLGSMEGCSTTTNCVQFTQHPIATISLFGKDMLHTGMMIVIVDAMIQALNRTVNGDDKTDTKSSDGGMFSSVAGKIGGAIKSIAAKYFVLTWVIKLLSIVSAILAIFGGVFIFAGIFIGYLVPMMPFVTQVMMWIAWFAEFLILFVVVPLLVAFSFMNKEDGSPLFKPTSIISMMSAIVLKAPLIFVSFMIFYTMSYAGVYIINSTMFTLFSIEFSTQGVAVVSQIMQIVHAVVFFVFVVSMYFIMFKNLTKLMSEIPDYVLRPMGVESLSVQVSTGVESFVMTAAIKNELTKALSSVGGSGGQAIGGAINKGKGGEKPNGDDDSAGGDEPSGGGTNSSRSSSDDGGSGGDSKPEDSKSSDAEKSSDNNEKQEGGKSTGSDSSEDKPEDSQKQ